MAAEWSFEKEVALLRLGAGEAFHGEGILAVTKALLQSGISYVGGYQGAPVSHLIDILVDAKDLMAEMGIHVEICANEAAAAAMLGASINYPVRGAVTWKSIVGTNVAADGLSNLASPGVIGGTLIVVGEDYGESASVIQERTHAMAMKSSLCLMDPRPHLPKIVEMVERSFELSEASNSPVMMELRVRACHLRGQFLANDNVPPAIGTANPLAEPAPFDYALLAHPPATFAQEKLKISERLPAARRFIVNNDLNEIFDGDLDAIWIVLQGGLYNTLARRLQVLGLADAYGNGRVPLLVLNVTHPLVPEQIAGFCAGKDAVLILEEGNPEFIEHQLNVILRKAGLATRILGKEVLPPAGEYTAEVIQDGLVRFLEEARPEGVRLSDIRAAAAPAVKARTEAGLALDEPPPARPPQFCTGCPERPVFAALKILQDEIGKVHIAADIGCHAFATFEPFSMGNSILGYGMSLASAAAVAPFQGRRSVAIMGDGGFWHDGLTTGVIGTLMNKGDAVLVIMNNGYASATGQQAIPSSARGENGEVPGMDIEAALRTLGVTWLRRVRTYSVSAMVETLREAITTEKKELKVIIADGECQLARQRCLRSENAKRLERRARVAVPRFGVDDGVCTGDHSCMRLSGCPSLTIKPNPDPLRPDPIATIKNDCVGCGLCGEVAIAAALCPAFYRAERLRNAGVAERTLHAMRSRTIDWLQRLGGAG